MTKNDIRKNMLAKRELLSDKELAFYGTELISKLQLLDEFCKASMVFVYVDAKNELPTKDLIKYLLKCNVAVCVPKTLTDGRMKAIRILDLEKDLQPGRFGILEPVVEGKNEIVSGDKIDIAIVPGLAFDRLGNRIGYGKGYYDRFFMENSLTGDIYKIGVCYAFQLLDSVDEVCCDENDVKMDVIITV